MKRVAIGVVCVLLGCSSSPTELVDDGAGGDGAGGTAGSGSGGASRVDAGNGGGPTSGTGGRSGGGTGGNVGTVDAGVVVTVSPKVGTVLVGQTLQLSATSAVTWSVTEANGCGAVDASGRYSAPSTVPDPAFCHVKATSSTDPARSDTATLTISAGASGTVGVWEDVTPAGMNRDPAAFNNGNFGVMDVVADPVRKTDLYAFTCYQGVYRSVDYGLVWKKVNAAGSQIETGRSWAAAIDNDTSRDPQKAPTLYAANGYGSAELFYRSTDWGVTWTGTQPAGAYSIDMDPYDNQHLLVGFHEAVGMSESTDGGGTWRQITTPGGNSIYPFFVDTGNAATTRATWLMVPQDWTGDGTYRTTDSAANWTKVSTFTHPHGSSQILNAGGGVIYAPMTYGIRQSKDYGVTWTTVSSEHESGIVGTPSTLYASPGVNYSGTPPIIQSAPRDPGTAWTKMNVPQTMVHGSKTLAATYDGSHHVIVQGSWMSGIWRYVEP